MKNLFLFFLLFASVFSFSQKMELYPNKFKTENKAYVRNYMGTFQNTIYYIESVRKDVIQIGGKDVFFITTFNCDNKTFSRKKIKYENNIDEFFDMLMGADDEVILFAKIKRKTPKKHAIVAIKLNNSLNVTASKILAESEKDIEGEKLVVAQGQKYFAVLTTYVRAVYDFDFEQISENKSNCKPLAKPCLTDDGCLYYVSEMNERLYLNSQDKTGVNNQNELKIDEGIIDILIKNNPATGNIHLIESFGESESKTKAYLAGTKNKNFLNSIRHTVFDKNLKAGKQEVIAIKNEIIIKIGNDKKKGVEWMSPDDIYFLNNNPILMLSKKYTERVSKDGKQDQYFSNKKDLLLINLNNPDIMSIFSFLSRIESWYHKYLIEPTLLEVNGKPYLFLINMSKIFKCDIEYGALNENLEFSGNKSVIDCKKTKFFPNFLGIVNVNDKYIITGDNGINNYGYAIINF